MLMACTAKATQLAVSIPYWSDEQQGKRQVNSKPVYIWQPQKHTVDKVHTAFPLRCTSKHDTGKADEATDTEGCCCTHASL